MCIMLCDTALLVQTVDIFTGKQKLADFLKMSGTMGIFCCARSQGSGLHLYDTHASAILPSGTSLDSWSLDGSNTDLGFIGYWSVHLETWGWAQVAEYCEQQRIIHGRTDPSEANFTYQSKFGFFDLCNYVRENMHWHFSLMSSWRHTDATLFCHSPPFMSFLHDNRPINVHGVGKTLVGYLGFDFGTSRTRDEMWQSTFASKKPTNPVSLQLQALTTHAGIDAEFSSSWPISSLRSTDSPSGCINNPICI